jgi:hypothetical protein
LTCFTSISTASEPKIGRYLTCMIHLIISKVKHVTRPGLSDRTWISMRATVAITLKLDCGFPPGAQPICSKAHINFTSDSSLLPRQRRPFRLQKSQSNLSNTFVHRESGLCPLSVAKLPLCSAFCSFTFSEQSAFDRRSTHFPCFLFCPASRSFPKLVHASKIITILSLRTLPSLIHHEPSLQQS